MEKKGVKGPYYAGHWVDLEDCAGTFQPNPSDCSGCPTRSTCPRSRSRNADIIIDDDDAHRPIGGGDDSVCDVVVVGAGCIDGAIVHEISRYDLRILLLESADDYSQGATKGNRESSTRDTAMRRGVCMRGIAGGGIKCSPNWEFRFGYQLNGSLRAHGTGTEERRREASDCGEGRIVRDGAGPQPERWLKETGHDE